MMPRPQDAIFATTTLFPFARQRGGSSAKGVYMFDETKLLASDIMTRDVAVVHPETTLLAAVKLMACRGISGLPVVDKHGTLVGMMSEADLLGWHEGFSEREARSFDLLAE